MRRSLGVFISTGLLMALAVTGAPAVAQTAGAFGSPVVFTPQEGTTLQVEGRGPMRGSIEVRREGGGVTVVNELSLEHYVMGIREVPGMWPMEALKAQAVAARTYALWESGRGYWRQFGFDVCATVACQVYQGAAAEEGERGRRWTEAVRATEGEVLLEGQGRPALTRYHSSSGGRTLNNEFVYPSDGPRPYLVSVDDPYDSVSALHEWRVSFKREDLERILRHAIGLAGTLSEVDSDQQSRRLVIRTLGGELEMNTVRFRREISQAAPRVFPNLYPGPRPDGQRMPETIPSSRFDVEKTDDGFILHGRGFGHGVGMSQHGALGRAQAGARYDQILGAYYTGLEPTQWRGDRSIRVAVLRGAGSVRVTGDGPFSVTSGGQTLSASTVGGWSVSSSGARSMNVQPPQGYQLPLALTGLRAPDELVVDPPEGAGSLEVAFVVPKAAQVTGVVTRGGEEVARAQEVVEAGERTLAIPVDPGRVGGRNTYQVSVEAFDGADTVSSSTDVVLVGPTPGAFARLLWALPVIALLLLLLRLRRRRRTRDRIVARSELEPDDAHSSTRR